jgi:hypothetical protein
VGRGGTGVVGRSLLLLGVRGIVIAGRIRREGAFAEMMLEGQREMVMVLATEMRGEDDGLWVRWRGCGAGAVVIVVEEGGDVHGG